MVFSRLLRALGWSAAAILLNGYSFGSGDQAIHLTFLRERLDPGAMAGDLVADHAAAHPSLFWDLQVPIVRMLGWEALPGAYLAAYVLALVATFVALESLAVVILGPGRIAWLAPALLVVFKVCPGHVRTFEPELINRTFAHPACLLALTLALRGRTVAAALVCGAAFNLHATTALHTLAAVAGCALVTGQGRRLALAAPLFLVAASPLLARLPPSTSPLLVDAAWMEILAWRMPHHLLPWRWPGSIWLAAGWQLGLYLLARRHLPSPRRVDGAVLGILVAGPMLGTLVAGPLPIAPLLALHLWEAWLLLAILAYVAAAGLLAALVKTRPLLTVVLGITLFVGPEATWVGAERSPTWRMNAVEDAALIEALAGQPPGMLVVPVATSPWIRASAGRALYVTTKDGGETVFDRGMALEWRARLALACGHDILAGTPTGWRGYDAVAAAAVDCSPEALERTPGTLLVLPAGHSSSRPLLWKGADWSIYDLR